ncbi:MAG: hypothetical protein HQK62_04335 [Desulfamplus sp.]|nr:hypothetical protein [Desulfamplus sp.]MBF0258060.1 hypothetical protein [Desulfamplus sp.]
MTNNNNPFSGASVEFDLRGRQSVRATFKLSEEAIGSLSLVAIHLGIKQKSLFDHLIDDAKSLNDIAENIRLRHFNKINRVQKTFVLSRRTLDILELIAKDHDTPRDALVEYSIRKLESVILAEKKRHEQRKKLFKELTLHWEAGKSLLEKSRKTLGDNDPFCQNLEKSMTGLSRNMQDLKSFIEKSSIIEDYQPLSGDSGSQR